MIYKDNIFFINDESRCTWIDIKLLQKYMIVSQMINNLISCHWYLKTYNPQPLQNLPHVLCIRYESWHRISNNCIYSQYLSRWQWRYKCMINAWNTSQSLILKLITCACSVYGNPANPNKFQDLFKKRSKAHLLAELNNIVLRKEHDWGIGRDPKIAEWPSTLHYLRVTL